MGNTIVKDKRCVDEDNLQDGASVEDKTANFNIDLGQFTVACTNRELTRDFAGVRIESWTTDDRNKLLDHIKTEGDEFLASEIYKVVGKKFKMSRETNLRISLSTKLSESHKVKVRICSKGEWITKEATLESESVAVFKTKELEHFVIIGDLDKKTEMLSPNDETDNVRYPEIKEKTLCANEDDETAAGNRDITIKTDLGQFTLISKSGEEANELAGVKIETWTMDDRNEYMDDIKTEGDEFLASQIYKVVDKKFQASEEIPLCVPLYTKLSKWHKIKVRMFSNGEWITKEAYLENGVVAVFTTKEVEHFVIIGDLMTKRVLISPNGCSVKMDQTSKIELAVPPGAVESDCDVTFKTIVQNPPTGEGSGPPRIPSTLLQDQPVIQNQVIAPVESVMEDNTEEDASEPTRSIVQITDCLYSDSNPTFLKQVTVKLPFKDRLQLQDTTLVHFRMVDDQIQLVPETELNMNQDGVCSLDVSGFSGNSVAEVKNTSLGDTQSLQSECQDLYGKNKRAVILIFREAEVMRAAGFPKVWVEMVRKSNVEYILKKRQNENKLIEFPNSRSSDFDADDRYRLRIDVAGNLKAIQGTPKDLYLLTYLKDGENHRIFPVEKRGTMGSPFGCFNFYNDKGKRECLHSLQVDAVAGFGKVFKMNKGVEKKQKNVNRGEDVNWMRKVGFYASHATPGYETPAVPTPRDIEQAKKQKPVDIRSWGQLCPALNEKSRFQMAEMIHAADDTFRLAIQLEMAAKYEGFQNSSKTQAQATFQLLTEWLKTQTEKETATETLAKCLNAAKLQNVADVFISAVKKNVEV